MKFWDTSAILPLCLQEPMSGTVQAILRQDEQMVVWWSTVIECSSAFARLRREGRVDWGQEARLRQVLGLLATHWSEVLPGQLVREEAARLLLNHPLRAADAMQMAAAVVWADHRPCGQELICLDERLREAARREGFVILPAGSDG